MNTRPAIADPQQGFTEGPMNVEQLQPAVSAGQLATVAAGVIPAMRVGVARDTSKVLARIKALAARAGRERYVYSWSVRNRRGGTSDQITGPTIKCALDVAREYGNCAVDVRVDDAGTHLVFYARFSDYETGFQLTRAFQQRKSQDIGMADKDRGADLIFQVGQSKAIRNVIINALSTYIDYAVEEAERGMLEWVKANADKARETIESLAKRNEVPLDRVVQAFGRPFDRFTEKDLASALTRLKGIDDGLTLVDDEFPEVVKTERPAGDPGAKNAARKVVDAEPQKPAAEAEPPKATEAEPPKDDAPKDVTPAVAQPKAAPPKAAPPKAAPAKSAAKSPLNFEE